MAHSRKLVLGGVALTPAKLPARKTALALGKVRDSIEKEMIGSGYLNGAPFKWVGLVIRQGVKDEYVPNYQKIDLDDGELPISIEIDVSKLLSLSAEGVEDIYRKATLISLLDVGRKYRLETLRLKELLAKIES